MKRCIQFGKYRITYTLIEKQVKNVNLHIQANGEIVVSCNRYVPYEKVDAFVAEKINWIIAKQQEIMKRNQANNATTHFAFLGISYPIEVILDNKEYVHIEEKCYVHVRSQEHVQNVLDKFARTQCKQVFLPIVQEIYEKMKQDYGLTYPEIKIRKMTSRWGSWMPARHQVTLDQRMVHYDKKFIEYVILHEFAHFIQPNHSKQFYYVIEKYMPDYKQASKLYNHLIIQEEM